MYKDSEGCIHMAPKDIELKFNEMIESEKILKNKLIPYMGSFELEEMVTMIAAYRDGGTAKVLEILEDDTSSLYSKRGSVLSS